ncbi:MAG: sigma 54-interacting transcriptional regulator [Acidobacteria bacterium]|nr:sigma 54-interacting transcriptional regulator [Acidobacteriota bacterium]
MIHDAEDECAALEGACRWARMHGASFAAFVGAGEGGVFAVDARRGEADLNPHERELCERASAPDHVEHPDGVSVAAAVRYAGQRIGAVLLRGGAEEVDALEDVAAIVAGLCGPAMRTRADAAMVLRSGERVLPEILGQSPAMSAVRDQIGRAAMTPFPVLIEGESGTGKELVARAVHRLSPRRDRRLAAINCAALADDLIDAELFGHGRGAFTGAIGPRTGLFEDAHGGTLFLDEVAELTPRAQAKLLRAIQEREVRRLGENVARPADARIVSATNKSLAAMVHRGAFREDLLFRLAVVRIRLPPLRERAEDVATLAVAFWNRLVREAGKRALLGPDALARLAGHTWPGNVRELQNVIAGLVVIAPARGRVGGRHVDQVLAEAGIERRPLPVSLARARISCERRTVAAALARHAGRRGAAARELGLSRQGLTKAMRRLRIGGMTAREGVA